MSRRPTEILRVVTVKTVANVWFRSEHPEFDHRARDVEIEVEGSLLRDIVGWGRRWRFSHREVSESPEGNLERWLVFNDKGPEAGRQGTP